MRTVFLISIVLFVWLIQTYLGINIFALDVSTHFAFISSLDHLVSLGLIFAVLLDLIYLAKGAQPPNAS